MKKIILIFILASTNVFCQNVISNTWYKNDSIVVTNDSIQPKTPKVSTYNLSLNLQESLVLRNILNGIEYSKLSVEEKRCLNSLNAYVDAFVLKPTTKVNVNLYVPIKVLSSFISQLQSYSESEYERKQKDLLEYEEKFLSKQRIFNQLKDFEKKKGIEKSIMSNFNF